MQQLFQLPDDNDNNDMIILNEDYFMDRVFKVVAFWRIFKKSSTRTNIARIDPKTYFASVSKIEDSTICCCLQDLIDSLLEPHDKLLQKKLRYQLHLMFVIKAKGKKNVSTDTGEDAGAKCGLANWWVDDEELMDRLMSQAREARAKQRRATTTT
uniref:Uncharacterized protein n=1 Tax=Trichogramma kaykai TaxID=54128 RepID=A0ABD2WTY3_9HYME